MKILGEYDVLTVAELDGMIEDLTKDEFDLSQEIDEVKQALSWAKEQLALRSGTRGRRVTLVEVRDYLRLKGRRTAKQVARHFGISEPTARKRIAHLVEQGVLLTVIPDAGAAEYEYIKASKGDQGLKARQTHGSRRGPNTGSGVPLTGRQNNKRLKRRGAIKGVGGH